MFFLTLTPHKHRQRHIRILYICVVAQKLNLKTTAVPRNDTDLTIKTKTNMSKTSQNGRVIAIVTCIFLFGMISFVTNLAAPLGVIWKNQPALGGSNMLGMMGNFMNFFAYLFMGIPAGLMLTKVGYKKTALIGIAFGFFGVLIQYLSSFVDGLTGFGVYLLGAFICGFSVCILNTVVNPMLNQLGGGGNHGNQLNLIGGTFNSLTGR